jgi:hypothetical protein
MVLGLWAQGCPISINVEGAVSFSKYFIKTFVF